MASGFQSRSGYRRGKDGERGFALLVVFLVAAGIMISLYLEIPRVAFESQRNREEMLIERGEQYSRAIELFYRKNKRYPQKMEDLETFNNQRFLRKRYRDPLTGKDEWRMIHMGPAGQLADSLVEKPGQQPGQQLAGNGTGKPQQGDAGGAAGVPGGQAGGVPGAPPNPDEVNVAMNRVRPSDRNPGNRFQQPGGFGPGSPGYDPNNPNAQGQQVDANGNPINDPNQNPGFNPGFNPNGQQQPGFNPGFNPNNPGFNQNNPNGQNGFNQPGQPGYNPNFPQNPSFPGQQPAYPNQPGINPNGGQPAQTVFYQNGQPFSAGGQLQGQLGLQNGQNPAQAGFGQNPALNAINNQLRNPGGFGAPSGFGTPSGFNNGQNQNGQTATSGFGGTGSGFNSGTSTSGFGTPAQTSPQSGQTFGGAGIAGVASLQTGVGIKRYNERTKYKEWEFIFDYRKPKTKPTTGVTGLQTSGTPSPFGTPQTPSSGTTTK